MYGIAPVIPTGSFFTQVSIPHLVCLELEGSYIQSSDVTALSTLFKTNDYKVPHISLLSVSDAFVEIFLAAVPPLKSIKLSNIEFSPKLISKLTRPNPDNSITWRWVGPSIQRLDIEYPEMEEEDISAFVAMVHSRILPQLDQQQFPLDH